MVRIVVVAEGGLGFAVVEADLDVGFVVVEEIPGAAEEVLVVEALDVAMNLDCDAGRLSLAEIEEEEEVPGVGMEHLAGNGKVDH